MSTTDLNRIENDLAATRTRLDSRIGLLQDRFTPGRIADDAVAYLRSSSGSEFLDSLTSSVKRNPLPVALTGIGLAWLVAASQRPAGIERVGATSDDAVARRLMIRERLAAGELRAARMPEDTDEGYRERLHMTRVSALGVQQGQDEDKASFATRVANMAGPFRDGTTAGVQNVRDKAGDLVDQTSDLASCTAGAASDAASNIGDRVSQGFDAGRQAAGGIGTSLLASPAMLGALGLAAGAVLAALIPQTDQEEAALCDIAGRVRHAASDAAQGVLDKGGAAAGAIVDQGRSSLQQHGFAGGKSAGDYVDGALSGNVSKKLKDVVTEVMDAGEAAARK